MDADLIGRFDIVHVRLFMFVVEEPFVLLRNVVSMLSMCALLLSSSIHHCFCLLVCCFIVISIIITTFTFNFIKYVVFI